MRFDYKAWLVLIIFYLLYAIGGALCYAEELPSKEPIVVNGDKVEYFHESKMVVGTGNISITYKDVVLTCDKITVYLDTREGIAEGGVKVVQKDAYFTGEKINYNFDSRKGTVINGYLNSKPFYGRAQEIDRLAWKDQFNLVRGYVTTCDYERPHYRVQSRQVRVYPDDKVVAKHILLFIGNVPVLYLPYYVQPLKERKSHISVVAGRSKEWGYYLLSSYRYYLDDKNRGDLLLDYRTRKGMAEGINHYYKTGEVGKGSFKFYYTKENDMTALEPDRASPVKTRYRYQARHSWDMGNDLDTLAILEFNKLSDPDIIKDYFYNEYTELGDQPDNYISVTTQKEDYTTQLLLRKRFDKFYTVVERLPEYKIDIPQYSVMKDAPIYYKTSASAAYINHTSRSVVPSEKDVDVIRFDAYNQLSYAANFFRSLSITPFGGVQNTYYSRNRWGDTNSIRTIFKAGLNNSIKFYKIYDVESNFLGLDMHKLRHIITPTANYYYTHQPTISLDNLHQFDDIDGINTANGINLALENKLQTKRIEGEGQLRSIDMATLIVSTDYMFRLKRDDVAYKDQKFKSVDFQLELNPYPWLYSISKMSIDTKRYAIQTESVDLVASGGDKWSLAVGQRYENTETDRHNLMSLDGIYTINDKWKVRLYERFNLRKGVTEEQEYTVYRNLHCWTAELTYNVKSQENYTIWFIFRLKAFPEYPIGFRRIYSRPQFGSAGPGQQRVDIVGP